MKKTNTKQEILDRALDLFSVNGYEATSMSDIADAVGIRKASLYAHYESKEEILNSLIDFISRQYEQNSLFTHTDFDDGIMASGNELYKAIEKQIRYIIHDPYVSKVRKLLVIEQFRNEQIGKLQQRHSYDNVMEYCEKMMKHFIAKGKLADSDPKVMAGEFCLPISMWVNLCDRMPKMEKEAFRMIKKHVLQFYTIYSTK